MKLSFLIAVTAILLTVNMTDTIDNEGHAYFNKAIKNAGTRQSRTCSRAYHFTSDRLSWTALPNRSLSRGRNQQAANTARISASFVRSFIPELRKQSGHLATSTTVTQKQAKRRFLQPGARPVRAVRRRKSTGRRPTRS